MFAARWCGDVRELLVARNILADKFGSDFTVAAKEGTGIVNPMVINVTFFISAFLAHPIDLKLKKKGFLTFSGLVRVTIAAGVEIVRRQNKRGAEEGGQGDRC